MRLARFAEEMEDITSTRSTNYKEDVIAGVVSDFAEDLMVDSQIEARWGDSDYQNTVDQLETFLRFATGHRFSDPERKTHFNKRSMSTAAREVIGVDEPTWDEIVDYESEMSEAVAHAWRVYSGERTELSDFTNGTDISDRTIADVYEQVDLLPDADGDTARQTIVADMLSDCESAREAKWVSFCVLNDISLYMGWKTVAKGAARALGLDHEDLYRARAMTRGDFPSAVADYLRNGSLRLDPEIGVPFKPMLAGSAELSELDADWVGQPKYDGIRALIHSDGDEVRVFSRNCKEYTEAFPEITENFEPEKEWIIDGEIVAYDPDTEAVLPFEKIMNRTGRVHDIEQKREEVEARLWVFDCVRYDGYVLDEYDLEDRLQTAHHIVQDSVPGATDLVWNGQEHVGNRFVKTTPTFTNLEESFELSTEEHEGIVAKDTAGHYLFERDSSWSKIKPSATVELRVWDARQGSGENSNRLGRVYVETSDGVRIGRCGIGFGDEMREKYDPENGEESLVGSIIEVTAEEISITGDEDDPDYGIRFPRFERIREESDAEVDSLERCIELLN